MEVARLVFLSMGRLLKYEEYGILVEPAKVTNSDGMTALTWSIGDLDSCQWKTIQMVVYPGECDPVSNKVLASGQALGIAVKATSNEAEPELTSNPESEGEGLTVSLFLIRKAELIKE